MVASHCKSAAKAITWRVLGAADTFVLSFLVTGKATAACGIVGCELFTKSVLYYGHERVWETSWFVNSIRGGPADGRQATETTGSRLRPDYPARRAISQFHAFLRVVSTRSTPRRHHWHRSCAAALIRRPLPFL